MRLKKCAEKVLLLKIRNVNITICERKTSQKRLQIEATKIVDITH